MQPGPRRVDQVANAVLDQAYRVHMKLGPGLTEKVNETLLEHYLMEAGHDVVRQKRIPFEVDGVKFKEGLRPDLIVDGVLVVEVKSARSPPSTGNRSSPTCGFWIWRWACS